ncbi:MAG: hypothetical protein GX493_12375 [Firmicutes bacterium]|nr:hypothetical protein [Bacillota bacterium]
MAEKNPFISGLIAKMSIDQKIGALLTLGFAGTLVGPHNDYFIICVGSPLPVVYRS